MALNFNAYAKEGNLFLKDCSEQFDLGEDKDNKRNIHRYNALLESDQTYRGIFTAYRTAAHAVKSVVC